MALLALSMIAVFALSTSAARAEAPRLIPDGQFKVDERAGSNGAFGVAVDQSTSESDPSRGDVYVTGSFGAINNNGTFEFVEGRVNKFDASGNLLKSPVGVGEAFAYSGAAVNPVNGNVYALGEAALFSPPSVFTYDPASGVPVGPPFPVLASNNGNLNTTVVGIATDSAGNVYVPVVPQNEVLEYNPTGTLLETFKGAGAGALKGPPSVSVDLAGNLWVADAGNDRIVELSPADTLLGEIPSEGVKSVAVDAHGDVFAIVRNSADFCGTLKPPCPHLVEYSSAGTQLFDFGAGQLAQKSNEALSTDMVAVSDSSGRVYVTEAGEHGLVFKFRPPVAPKLEGEVAVEVGVSGAKLGAVVDPGGISAAYRFEYGTTEAYGSRVPFPEGDTGGGFTSLSVWAGVSGLQPGTTYHYRVVVTGELGEPLVGKDQTFTTETPAQASCPNEQLRTGFSAALPDCRAYELVTPPNKDSAQPDKTLGGYGPGELNVENTLVNNLAAPDGNRLTFIAKDVRPGSPSAGQIYLSTRDPGGWSDENLIPPTNYYGNQCPGFGRVSMFSQDFSKAIIPTHESSECGGPEPELVSGEPRDTPNLFLRDNTTGSYELVNLTPPGVTPADAEFLGASADLGRVVFREQAKLTENAPEGVANVYEWSGGAVRLVSVLADGTPVAGSFEGLSSDGSRVFFTADGGLYVRIGGAETVQLDASQVGGSGGGGSVPTASDDGSQVFFTDDASAKLTSDTQSNSGTNLYHYDATAPAGQRLTDLTPVAQAGAPAVSGLSKDGSQVFFTDDASAALTADTVSGSGTNLYRYDAGAPAGQRLTDLTPVAHPELQQVLGVSEDGSSVYIKAAGVLTGEANQHGEMAQSGQPNLYLFHGGATTFIVTNTTEGASQGRLKLSANGAFLAFESVGKLTGYDNTSQSTGQPVIEIYLYDAAANSLACATCNPSGAPPTAEGAGKIEGSSHSDVGAFEKRAPHNLSENGQVFFDTAEALLPADTNGVHGCSLASGAFACTDVYEFEPSGVGTCADAAGCVFLISTGTGSLETFFIDASPSGNDVFIREFQKLVPRDTQEGASSLYDVRVDGGFPEPSPPPPCTTADACRTAPAPQPLIFGAPASQTFSGVGNLAPTPPAVKAVVKSKQCRKGLVKKKGKCVKKKGKARKPTHANKKTGK